MWTAGSANRGSFPARQRCVCRSETPGNLHCGRVCTLRLWKCQGRQQHLSCSSSTVTLPASDTVSASFGFLSPIWGIKMFLNGRKELPSRSFSSYFPHAVTEGGRGVCVAQTCTDARLAHKTAHIGTTRPTPRSKRLRRRAFPTCAIVQPLVLRLQAALGSGFSLQAAFWYQNAMLALFLQGKKSLKRSLRLLPPFRTPHKI